LLKMGWPLVIGWHRFALLLQNFVIQGSAKQKPDTTRTAVQGKSS
jgi:hypothetical protein